MGYHSDVPFKAACFTHSLSSPPVPQSRVQAGGLSWCTEDQHSTAGCEVWLSKHSTWERKTAEAGWWEGQNSLRQRSAARKHWILMGWDVGDISPTFGVNMKPGKIKWLVTVHIAIIRMACCPRPVLSSPPHHHPSVYEYIQFPSTVSKLSSIRLLPDDIHFLQVPYLFMYHLLSRKLEDFLPPQQNKSVQCH